MLRDAPAPLPHLRQVERHSRTSARSSAAISIAGDGVHATSYYGGAAVYAESAVHAGQSGPVVHAVSHGGGAGVEASSSYGPGIVGMGGRSGRGGLFTGGAAALQLAPSSAPTHPAAGQAGDLFVDAGHRLWYCYGGTAWKQLA